MVENHLRRPYFLEFQGRTHQASKSERWNQETMGGLDDQSAWASWMKKIGNLKNLRGTKTTNWIVKDEHVLKSVSYESLVFV